MAEVTPETEAPAMAAGLVVGELVPALSDESDIPYLESKLDNVKAQFSLDDVPLYLQDPSCSSWKNMKLLKDTFKFLPEGKSRTKKVDHQYPYCLVLDAKTVQDRLIVMSWWCSLDKEGLFADAKQELRDYYKRPTTSNERVVVRQSNVTGRYDDPERLQEYVDNSSSSKIAKREKKRKVNEQPESIEDLYDATSRDQEKRTQLRFLQLVATTRAAPGSNVPAEYNPYAAFPRTVATPPKYGRGTAIPLDTAKNEIVAVNEAALSDSLGETVLAAMKDDPNTRLVFLCDEEGQLLENAKDLLPAVQREKRRANPKTQTDEEVRQNTQVETTSVTIQC